MTSEACDTKDSAFTRMLCRSRQTFWNSDHGEWFENATCGCVIFRIRREKLQFPKLTSCVWTESIQSLCDFQTSLWSDWSFFCFLSFQALAGEGGYGEPRPSIFVERQPYYPAYPARIPLDYGIRRTYSGDYIGPGATNVSEELSFVYYRAIVTIVLLALHEGFTFFLLFVVSSLIVKWLFSWITATIST